MEQFVLQSCFFSVLPRHTNLFYEYAARCVHLCPQEVPQEEECTFFLRGQQNIWQLSKFTEDAN